MGVIVAITDRPNRLNYARQIAIIGVFFFIFGFITWVNGTLIPYFRIACELEEWQAYLVTFAFYISYTIMALPSSKILQNTGMVNGVRLGLVIMALGCLLFVPAALLRYYPIFLLGLFVVGTGTTLLQTAVNPYITFIGPPERAAQRISIMGICNKFAGVLAPIILGAIILKNSDGLLKELQQLSPLEKSLRLDLLAEDVILPYSILTLILLGIAFLIKYAKLPEIKTSSESDEVHPKDHQTKVVRHSSAFLLGFIAIFCAVGVEVIAGDTIGNYGIYHGLNLDVAKSLTSYTLAAMMAGYIFGIIAIPRLLSQHKVYLYSSLLGILFTVLAIILPGKISIIFIALLGFSNAILWPAIWPLALKNLKGPALHKGSAILIMGVAGGALLPLLYGWLVNYSNNQVSYWILIPAYFFNVYFALSHRK